MQLKNLTQMTRTEAAWVKGNDRDTWTTFYTNISGKQPGVYNFITTHFKTSNSPEYQTKINEAEGRAANAAVIFGVSFSIAQDVISWRAYLAAQYAAGTPVTVQYKLAEPTIEQIDPVPLPTYPRYTALSCSESVTAKVRVVEK